MNICFLTLEYHTEPYKAGGIARAYPKLAHGLADRGHAVTVCVRADRDESFEERPGVRVVRYRPRPLTHWRLRSFLARRYPQTLQMLDTALTVAARVRELRDEVGFDVVHSTGSYLAFEVVRQRRVPVVIRLSSYWPVWAACNFDPPYLGTAHGRLADWMEKEALAGAAFVYAPSACVARMYEEILGRPVEVLRTPMFALPSPANPAPSPEPDDGSADFLLYCASLEGSKGAHLLARVLPEFLRRHPGLSMVLAGRVRNAPDGARMDEFIARTCAGEKQQIRLLPPLDQSALFALMKKARAVVLPSLVDNLPNVLLEAMYLGRVVVGARGASFDEILEDGEDGILVDAGRPDELRRGLERVMDMSGPERARMGERAREKAARLFDPDPLMNRLVDRYRAAAKSFRPAAGASFPVALGVAGLVAALVPGGDVRLRRGARLAGRYAGGIVQRSLA
jgi:glycosyltransferase involved in cell wall biosynthesis